MLIKKSDYKVNAGMIVDPPPWTVAELSAMKADPLPGAQGKPVGEASLERALQEAHAAGIITRPVEVTITPDGPQVTAGRHLLQAAREAGITEVPVRLVGGVVIPLTQSQKLVGEYSRRFGHSIPWPTLKNMVDSGEIHKLPRIIRGALQMGEPVPEWRDYRPIEGTMDAVHGGYKNPPRPLRPR